MSDDEEKSNGWQRWNIEAVVGPLVGAIIGGLFMYYWETTPSELQADLEVHQVRCEWKGVDCEALSSQTEAIREEFKIWSAEVSNEGEKVSQKPELVVEGTVLARLGSEAEWSSTKMRDGAVRLSRKLQQGERMEVWGVSKAGGHPGGIRAYVRDDNGAGSVFVQTGTLAPATIGDWIKLAVVVGVILLSVGRVSYLAGKMAGTKEIEEKLEELEPKIAELQKESEALGKESEILGMQIRETKDRLEGDNS